MAGHVFIVHGDITRIACDAWLLPGGPDAAPGITWSERVACEAAAPLPVGWPNERDRVVLWKKMREPDPEVFLADVGGTRETPLSWYIDAARQFLQRAFEKVSGAPPRCRRTRHLLALPLLGTGYGGKRLEAGAVARELLPALHDFTDAHDTDVALVMIEGPAYSAVQAVRRTLGREGAWQDLEPEVLKRADILAAIARRRELTLFLGAGIGVGAGLPMWSSLLDELARERTGMPDHVLAQLRGLSTLDRAHIIEGRMPEGESLSAAVAELFRSRSTHYALAHALLAALPVSEVVTTNYDTLFEQASEATGRKVTVLPYSRLSEGSRWLLKMHGCVTRPEDIVLTRENFLTYRERREALAGIVQALLITRHMLFVGFSLEDDNFHHIVRAVRRAVAVSEEARVEPERPFGTSLMISANPIMEELWRGSLQWISLGDSHQDAARKLEVFLDRLAAGSTDLTAHLFDRRYDEVLSRGEKELRDSLADLHAQSSPEARKSHAFERLEELMRQLGWKGS